MTINIDIIKAKKIAGWTACLIFLSCTLYDAEHKFCLYRFHLSKTDEKLTQAVIKLDRAAATGVSGRIAKCEAEVEKLREMKARLSEKTEFWEKVTGQMSRLCA